jgi:alcohol dehydrogenase class IV
MIASFTGPFTFRTASRIVFGRGSRAGIAAEAARLGRRILWVTGARSLAVSGESDVLAERFEVAGLEVARWAVSGEPDTQTVDRGAAVAVAFEADAVVAVGGGSVLDAAKAIAAAATNGGAAIDYLEDLPAGGGRALEAAPLPLVAVPTTAGTGSEVTRNAVLRVPEASLKRSMRDDRMLPSVALVDADLAARAPVAVAVPAALDALTHLIEAYVSRGAQPITDLLALEGARRAARALEVLSAGESDAKTAAWDELALASLWGGIALANAGLGAVHGLAAPVGGRCAVPHGAACAALLAPTVRANVEALRSREPGAPALARYAEVATALTGSADPGGLATFLDSLRKRLGAAPLSAYGSLDDHLSAIVEASRGGSMKNNPIRLTDGELDAILRAGLAGRL